MSRHEAGFGLIAILVTTIALAVAGTASWYVYTQQNVEPEVTEVTESEETTSENPYKPSGETANWATERSARYKYSYRYPQGEGWESKPPEKAPHAVGSLGVGSVNYTLCGPNCGLVLSVAIYRSGSGADPGETWGEKRMENNNFYKLASKNTTEIDGVTGTRWEYTPASSDVSNIVYYYFSRDDFSYAFEVNLNGASNPDKDFTEYGEKIMGTLQFID